MQEPVNMVYGIMGPILPIMWGKYQTPLEVLISDDANGTILVIRDLRKDTGGLAVIRFYEPVNGEVIEMINLITEEFLATLIGAGIFESLLVSYMSLGVDLGDGFIRVKCGLYQVEYLIWDSQQLTVRIEK